MSETTTKKPKKGSRLEAAEVRKMEAEAAQAELELERTRLEVLGLQEQRASDKEADKRAGVFTLETSVGSGTVSLANEIRRWARANPEKPITLQIFTPGGSIMHGFVLYDALRTLSKQGHHITTLARGYAASMGAIIFLAGDTRIVGSEAQIMCHALAAGGMGTLYELEDDLKFYKRLQSRLDNIIVSRTKIDRETLSAKTKKKDWWIGAKQAVKLGVAHSIG